MFPELDKNIDLNEMEENCRTLWDESGVYNYDPNSSKETFSIDTPPPYVSAAHLHVGHAMSYTQAEIMVRYKRMCGYNIFYPMGFDDNGLPTERFVEKKYKINKKKTTRSEFRKLCIEETQQGGKAYEELWRAMGLSVDWSLRYSTIDDRCRHTAQKSFLDLYNKELIKRENEPVLWDTHFETSLAQADLETLERKGKLYDIRFDDGAGNPLVISTTRPELIPCCVGLFFNPDDERYRHLIGKKAVVPLFDIEVPVLTSEDVEKDFGTGLMMCCTFGDGEDVKKWKENKLETRICITPDGKMTDLAGPYAGKQIVEARANIVKDLKEQDLVLDEKNVTQNVSIGERSETPVEFVMAPQWFIKVMDHKEALLKRAKELKWFPDWMQVRLEHWIEGLKYDWNVSRQRFYGVPFPVWYVEETGDVIVADEADLPVDPTEDSPPAWALEKYKGMTIVPETDVMDTWMTSSLSPQINCNWAGREDQSGDMGLFPMSLRVQAFEIIRTWLFYTLIKADYHNDSLPWKEVMISGWGLNEQGKKISKRDLEQFTDENGYNRYDPYSLVRKYGADSIRYWAASSKLGMNLKFYEKEVKDGKKIVTKLWNVARMTFMYMDDFDPAKDNVPFADRTIEDQWVSAELNNVVKEVTQSFDVYDYATAKERIHKFFWITFCDRYLELIKARFWENSEWSDEARRSAQTTLYESLRKLLMLLAPFMPYVTEELYQKANRFGEEHVSLHVSPWVNAQDDMAFDKDYEMSLILDVFSLNRKIRSEQQVSMGAFLETLTIAKDDGDAKLASALEELELSLKSAARAQNIKYIDGNASNDNETALAIRDIVVAES